MKPAKATIILLMICCGCDYGQRITDLEKGQSFLIQRGDIANDRIDMLEYESNFDRRFKRVKQENNTKLVEK